ncbi:hypothetical protein [Streptomyces sp. NPDC006333]|uniref:hypothetical protein n=1 Tax=Streptomyces sp. NPDC006333 TaxID=3156753 RepID=UPI0033ABA3CE
MKCPFPPGSLLYLAGGLSGLCVTVIGAGAGSWWMRSGAWAPGWSWARDSSS